MQEAKQKNRGFRVLMDNLFQRLVLSKDLVFFSLFDLQDYERTTDSQEMKEDYTGKWRYKEKACCKKILFNTSPSFLQNSS
jgi:hypothetical protein